MLPVTAESIFNKVRALENDNDGAVYTDTVIIPYFQIAYDDLRNELEDYQVPIANVTSDIIVITAGVLGIGGSDQPALPRNLVEVLSMYERLSGTNDQFMLMDHRQFLPEINVPTTYLQYWAWEDQQIKFLGATANLDVKMHYIGDNLGDPSTGESNIRIFNSRNYLAFRTAALCAMYVMENDTRATALNINAGRCLDTLLSIMIKPQQSIITRRRPFMGRYKQAGGRYYW